MDDELTKVAMQIILCAGDARNKASDAVELALAGNYEKAAAQFDEARHDLQKAHKAQTEVIQAEAAGTKHDVTLLFVHAQDTLMTITSELNNYEQLVNAFRCLKGEIEKCKK